MFPPAFPVVPHRRRIFRPFPHSSRIDESNMPWKTTARSQPVLPPRVMQPRDLATRALLYFQDMMGHAASLAGNAAQLGGGLSVLRTYYYLPDLPRTGAASVMGASHTAAVRLGTACGMSAVISLLGTQQASK